VPYGNQGQGIRCTVEIAAGDRALVVNEKHNTDDVAQFTELFPDFCKF